MFGKFYQKGKAEKVDIKSILDRLDNTGYGLSTLAVGIQDSVNGVYLDGANGVPGTTYPIGTPGMPVSNLADALAIAAARKSNHIHINGAYTFNSAVTGIVFTSSNGFLSQLNLNGKAVSACIFNDLYVLGNGSNTSNCTYHNCLVTVTPLTSDTQLFHCALVGSISVAGYIEVYHAVFKNVVLDFSSGSGGSFIYGGCGLLVPRSMIRHGDTWSNLTVYGSDLRIYLEPSNTDGHIWIYGDVRVEGETGGTLVYDSTSHHKLSGLVTAGVYSHPDGLAEQVVMAFAATQQKISLRMDLNNLNQNITIREYEQVDENNYRELSAKVFPTDFDTGAKAAAIEFNQSGAAYKVTLQSVVAEGGIKNIPYRYMTQDLS